MNDEPKLTPEQEAEAKRFADELNGVSNAAGKGWYIQTPAGMVKITDDEYEGLRRVAYETKMAQIRATGPTQFAWYNKAAGIAFYLGLAALTIAGTIAGVKAILGL